MHLRKQSVDFRRVMRSRLKLGIAQGWMKADGEIIYQASDLRVGLFKDEDGAEVAGG